jgi:hypothetical protein
MNRLCNIYRFRLFKSFVGYKLLYDYVKVSKVIYRVY